MGLENAAILLVEDEEYDVELTLAALADQEGNNKVHVTRDGVEALEYLAECEAKEAAGTPAMPRLVLLDLNLPRLGGIEVAKRIKSNPLTKVIPVVVFTSSVEDEDVMRSYSNGVNSYLQKPIGFDEFCKVIKQLNLYWILMNRAPVASALSSEKGQAEWVRL